MTKIALALGFMATALLLVAAIASLTDDSASAGTNAMEAMSVDTITDGNDATTLGPREECVEVSADSEVDVDVTALNIPESNPMIAFNFVLEYDSDYLSVVAVDSELMLAAAAGSSLFDVSDLAPDTDGSFLGSTADITQDAEESGSGVLARLTLGIDADTPPGGYPLILSVADAAHVGLVDAFPPQSLNHGQLAVDVTCDSLPPPGPAPFAFARGDNDCDNDTDSVDALKGLQHVAGIGFSQEPGCPALGTEVASIIGDVDCDDDVDSVDALKILRHVAGLSVSQNDPCTNIGEPF